MQKAQSAKGMADNMNQWLLPEQKHSSLKAVMAVQASCQYAQNWWYIAVLHIVDRSVSIPSSLTPKIRVSYSTQNYIPEGSTLYIHRCENLKSGMLLSVYR
jgi:hypothetical protein